MNRKIKGKLTISKPSYFDCRKVASIRVKDEEERIG